MPSAKLFISHASEDKSDFVEPLALALIDEGYDVWFDKFSLTLGDSLLRRISDGLRECDFGIVVLSNHFFAKKWPRSELDGLFSIETEERKVILPIWKGVTEAEVKAFSPILAGKLAARAERGVAAVIAEINRAVDTSRTVEKFSAIDNVDSRFQMFDKRLAGSLRAEQLASSVEGVELAAEAIRSVIATMRKKLDELAAGSERLKFHFDDKVGNQALLARGPYSVKLIVGYWNNVTNSLSQASLLLRVSRMAQLRGFTDDKEHDVIELKLRPSFDHTLKLIWKDRNHSLTTEQFAAFALTELVSEMERCHSKAQSFDS